MSSVSTAAAPAPPGVAAANPFVGPFAYELGDERPFIGRDKEADSLLSRIVTDGIVLFYAQSGAGKSSLVNARLIPQLVQYGFKVFPVARVGLELPDDININDIDNVFVFNLLWQLTGRKMDPRLLLKKRIKDFLLPQTANGKRARPAAHPAERRKPPRPRVIILDQFEEILTNYRELNGKRKDFFEQLKEVLKDDPGLSILFVMREDFIAGLDRYGHLMPNQLQSRFHLERLRLREATDAARVPAKQAGRPFQRDEERKIDVAAELITNLAQEHVAGQDKTITGEFVEPVQLQVVCYQLWEELSEEAPPEITREHLAKYGDVDKALENFYQRAVVRVAASTGIPESQIHRWFGQRLITRTGIRAQVNEENGSAGGLSIDAVKLLVDEHLIRAEKVRGGTWYELAHDRLIDPILQYQSNIQKLEREGHISLVNAAVKWQEADRDKSFLFRGKLLSQAQDWAIKHPDGVGGLEHEFLAASSDADAASTRRLRRLSMALGLALLVTTVVSVYALKKSGENDRARRIARSSLLAADATKNLNTNPERSLLLALQALTETYPIDKEKPTRQAFDALNLAAQNSRVRLTLQVATATTPYSVALSKDNKYLATAEGLSRVNVWNAFSGRLIGTLATDSAQDDPVDTPVLDTLTFSADGQRLAAAGRGKVGVWEFDRGLKTNNAVQKIGQTRDEPPKTRDVPLQTQREGGAYAPSSVNQVPAPTRLFTETHPGKVTALAFDPSGSMLAAGGGDGKVTIWRTAGDGSVKKQTSDEAHDTEVVGVALRNLCGQLNLVSVSKDGVVKVWDAGTGRLTKTLGEAGKAQVKGFSFHEKNEDEKCSGLMALVNEDGGAKVLSLTGDSKLPPFNFPIYTNKVQSVAFSPNGQRLAMTNSDGTVRVLDVSNLYESSYFLGLQELFTLSGHTEKINAVVFNDDGTRLATASDDKTIKMWDASSGHLAPLDDIAFSDDGTRLASASGEGRIIITDVNSQNQLNTLTVKGAPTAVAYSADNRLVAVASMESLLVWNSDNGKIVPAWEAFERREDRAPEKVTALTLSPCRKIDENNSYDRSCGDFLVTGSEDGTIKIWRTKAAKVRSPRADGGAYPLPKHGGRVRSIAFSHDGRLLATASDDKTVKVWEVESGRELFSPLQHSSPVSSVAFSHDGKYIATGGEKEAKIWGADNGRELETRLVGHTAQINDLAFDAKGQLITASDDGSVKVWKVPSGELVRTVASRSGSVKAIAVTRDGNHLALADGEKTPFVYYLDLKDLLELARRRVTRPWTQDECSTYLDVKKCPKELRGESDDTNPQKDRVEEEAERVELMSGLDLLIEAKADARENMLASAKKKLELANDKYPVLDLNPEIDASVFAAEGLIETVHNISTAQDWKAFIELRQAQVENAEASEELRGMYANMIKTAGKLGLGRELVLAAERIVRTPGEKEALAEVSSARDAFYEAKKLDPAFYATAAAGYWNNLCWYGSVKKHPEIVRWACEEAVSREPEVGSYRDSRGIAQALLYQHDRNNVTYRDGAIKDFEFFIQRTPSEEKRKLRLKIIGLLNKDIDLYSDEQVRELLSPG